MIRALLAAALLVRSAAAAGPAEPPQARARPAEAPPTGARPTDASQRDLVAGRLPEDPARAVVLESCILCHTVDYVTQQRLTPGQWQKTVEKMRRFGAPLTDDEVKLVVGYLSRYWTVDLPEPLAPKPVAPPKGSLPAR
jgi:mono/diheme cytochrome c family protein